MVNLTRIYTRTGDGGETRLGDMSVTTKNDLRLHAYADVDEANATLGLAIACGGLDDDGVRGIIVFIGVTIASDTGGYVAGVLFGKHPMAPVISPKKSWEGFAGSMGFTVAAGILLVVWLLDGDWWVGIFLGLIAVVMATLGDLCESVMKRDLGIKDMSQVIPGHGGLMDRIDAMLPSAVAGWAVLTLLA